MLLSDVGRLFCERLFCKCVIFFPFPPTGSPLQFFVDAVNSGVVTAYGPGLSYGMVNRPAAFTVVTKNAGEGTRSLFLLLLLFFLFFFFMIFTWRGRSVRACCSRPFSGGLSLAVEGPSKAEITCKDNKDGTCTVSYLPTAPGDYNIIVKFDNKHIPGSPFTAKITGKICFNLKKKSCFFFSIIITKKQTCPAVNVQGTTPSPGRPSSTWARRLTCRSRSPRLI